MKKNNFRKIVNLFVTASLALAVSEAANAKIIGASSEGYGASIDLTIAGANVDSGALPAGAHGVAPGAYDVSDETLALSGDLLGLGLINLDVPVLTGAASSDVDGTLGGKTTKASGGLTDLSADIRAVINILGLSVGAVNAEAKVQGDLGGLTAEANSSVAGLGISLLGLNPLPIDLNSTPNYEVDLLGLLNLTGVSLILNEQLINGDPNGICLADSCNLEVNALHLAFNRFPIGLNLVSGSIKLGHAYAAMTASAVPVPAAVWLFGSGLIGLFGFSRRQG